jgi:hypothetical protein
MLTTIVVPIKIWDPTSVVHIKIWDPNIIVILNSGSNSDAATCTIQLISVYALVIECL